MQSAVLFLVFNRPDKTQRVFDEIKGAKPPRLYVAADGPRTTVEGEDKIIEEVRNIATNVDWECEVKTLFRRNNLGCKTAVSDSLNWFFEQEEEGIILEDDCLPHQDFFSFCDQMLINYRDENRVSAISGTNFQNGIWRGDGSYYFSKYNHIWGWATWRRSWDFYDGNIEFWPNWKKSDEWIMKIPYKSERDYWSKIFDQVFSNKINSWGYPWTASIWFKGGLTVIPNVNLVSNIGFDLDSTHTSTFNSLLADLKTDSLGEIVHPEKITQDTIADRYTFDHIFSSRYHRFPWSLLSRFNRSLFSSLKRRFS